MPLNLFIPSLYILYFTILFSLDNEVLETSKHRAMFYNILSQISIVKFLTKFLLIRILLKRVVKRGTKFGPNTSYQKFSVCITALFALTYLISSTILREISSEAIFIFPPQYPPAICKFAELVRFPGKLTEPNYATA